MPQVAVSPDERYVGLATSTKRVVLLALTAVGQVLHVQSHCQHNSPITAITFATPVHESSIGPFCVLLSGDEAGVALQVLVPATTASVQRPPQVLLCAEGPIVQISTRADCVVLASTVRRCEAEGPGTKGR